MIIRLSKHLHCIINGCLRCFFAKGMCATDLTEIPNHITSYSSPQHPITLHRRCLYKQQRMCGILPIQQPSLHLKDHLKAVLTAKSKIREKSKLKLSLKNKMSEQKKAVQGNTGRGNTFCASSLGVESAK